MDRISAFEERYIPEPNSGCWIWLGMQQSGKEYGLFYWKRKTVKAHRASWTLYRGVIPAGMHVCHKCDLPMCVNPDHLFLGSHSDNMADMMKKGRGNAPRGSHNGNSKLNEELVRQIRSLNFNGLCGAVIARQMGVNKSTVG